MISRPRLGDGDDTFREGAAIGLSVVLQLVVIYVPFLNSAFGTTPLGPWAWVECICLAAVVLIASEIYKAIMRAIDRKRGIMA